MCIWSGNIFLGSPSFIKIVKNYICYFNGLDRLSALLSIIKHKSMGKVVRNQVEKKLLDAQ